MWAALFCLGFMICEAIGGYMANSLAIMTDAAHLLADLAGFLISVFALVHYDTHTHTSIHHMQTLTTIIVCAV